MPAIFLPLAVSISGMAALDDPLAPARRGQIRCSIPDTERKTCRTFGRYSRMSRDQYDVDVTGITTNEGLVIEYHAAGSIEQGAICITLSAETIAQARFYRSGITLTDVALARSRQQTIEFLGPLLGKKLCSRDRREGADIVAEASVNGVRVPELDKPVRWIKPEDGYSIAPPEGPAI